MARQVLHPARATLYDERVGRRKRQDRSGNDRGCRRRRDLRIGHSGGDDGIRGIEQLNGYAVKAAGVDLLAEVDIDVRVRVDTGCTVRGRDAGDRRRCRVRGTRALEDDVDHVVRRVVEGRIVREQSSTSVRVYTVVSRSAYDVQRWTINAKKLEVVQVVRPMGVWCVVT